MILLYSTYYMGGGGGNTVIGPYIQWQKNLFNYKS